MITKQWYLPPRKELSLAPARLAPEARKGSVYIHELEWNDDRIEHVARHDVEPEEVWEVCEDPLHLARRQGRDRYRLYGQTESGRYLFVVLEQAGTSSYTPITARDMTAGEKQNFRRLRK